MSDYDDMTNADVMSGEELAENNRDAAFAEPNVDQDDMPCGEGHCHCYCSGGHVCGCDCWRCPECQQLAENCFCSEEGE